MTKTIAIMAALLAATWIGLSAISDRRDFEAEKMLYKAIRAGQKIAENPDIVPPGGLAFVETTLADIPKKYPATAAAEISAMKLAEFYTLVKKYPSALEILNRIIKVSGENTVKLSQALFLKGSILERQNQWQKALAVYNTLRDRCVDTPLGLQVPLYIANYYSTKVMTAEAADAYNDAVSFYQKVSREKRGSVIGYWASSHLITACINLKKYDEAGRAAEEMMRTYSSTASFMQNLSTIEHVYVRQLNRPERALEIYKDILARTNDKQLRATLKRKIAELHAKP